MPSRKLGVVVLTNSGGAGADDIGMHLLDPAMPLAPKPALPKERQAISLPVAVLERYVGTYEFAPNNLLEITLRDEQLIGRPTAQTPFRLWPETETDFFLREVDAQITFVHDAQRIVTGLVLHQNGQNPAAKKIK